MAQGVETSFFRDFVDNSTLRLGKSLLTEDGRTAFYEVKFMIKSGGFKKIIRDLPHEREAKLLRMAMIQHAISQILSEIATYEDRRGYL